MERLKVKVKPLLIQATVENVFPFLISGVEFWVSGFGFRGRGGDLMFSVWGLGFRVQDSGFRVSGLGLRVWSSGCLVEGVRLQGLGVRV